MTKKICKYRNKISGSYYCCKKKTPKLCWYSTAKKMMSCSKRGVKFHTVTIDFIVRENDAYTAGIMIEAMLDTCDWLSDKYKLISVKEND